MRFRREVRAFVLILAFLGQACSSAMKNARKNLENGNFDAAVEQFESILVSKPNDPEVTSLLAEARQGAIGRRLIDARMARLGEDLNGSLERLREVIELERKWGVGPKAQAAFTQNEEISYAWPKYDLRVKDSLKSNRPLQAEWLLRRYSLVFEGGQNAKGLNGLRSETQRLGAEDCRKRIQSAQPQLLHHASFLKRYCSVWSTPWTGAPAQSKVIFEARSGMRLGLQTEGMTNSEVLQLKGAVDRAFRDTVWFHPEAVELVSADLMGSYDFQHTSRSVRRVHSYQAIEKYTEKDKTTGLDVAKEKRVPRQYPYTAIEHHQTVKLRTQLVSADPSLSMQVAEESSDSRFGDEQRETNLSVGLQPQRPNLLDRTGYLSQRLDAFETKIKRELNETWVRLYCVSTSSVNTVGNLESIAPTSLDEERLFRCARVLGLKNPQIERPEFAETVSQQNFGLGIREVLSVIGN